MYLDLWVKIKLALLCGAGGHITLQILQFFANDYLLTAHNIVANLKFKIEFRHFVWKAVEMSCTHSSTFDLVGKWLYEL